MTLTQNDGVGREDCKVGVEFVEEVKLIGLAADAVGKEKRITLQPRNGLSRVFETNAWTAHDEEWQLKDVWVYMSINSSTWKNRRLTRSRWMIEQSGCCRSSQETKLTSLPRSNRGPFPSPLTAPRVGFTGPKSPFYAPSPGSDKLALGFSLRSDKNSAPTSTVKYTSSKVYCLCGYSCTQ